MTTETGTMKLTGSQTQQRAQIMEAVFEAIMAADEQARWPERWGLEWPGADAILLRIAGTTYRLQLEKPRPSRGLEQPR